MLVMILAPDVGIVLRTLNVSQTIPYFTQETALAEYMKNPNTDPGRTSTHCDK